MLLAASGGSFLFVAGAPRSAPRLSPVGFLRYLLHPEVASYSRQKPRSAPQHSPAGFLRYSLHPEVISNSRQKLPNQLHLFRLGGLQKEQF